MTSALLALGSCGDVPPAPPPTARAPTPATQAEPDFTPRLVAAVDGVSAGHSFDIGLHFPLTDGWHVYWEYPGDSGMPTRAELTAPAGTTVGPIRYPAPIRFVSPGDIVSYGYEKEALLLSQVEVATAPTVEPVRFTAKVRWLACSDICVPGKADLTLELPLVTTPQASADAPLFTRQRRRLAAPWASLPHAAATWLSAAATPTLRLTVDGAEELELFPASGPRVLHQDGTGDTLEIAYDVTVDSELLPTQGVLRVRSADHDAYYEVTVPWPESLAGADGG